MRTRWMVLSAFVALLVGACAEKQEPPPEYPLLEEPQPATEATAEEEETPPPEPAPPPPPPVRVVAAERTPLEGKAPSIRVLRPRNGQTIRRGDVKVIVRLKNWKLEEAPGKHIHVIVDNEPYMAIRDVKKPLDLNELVQENLGHELAEGTHLLRTFPSRATHESVKEDTPFAMVVFNYKKKSDDWDFDPKAPLLTYSRPKGCYPEGERILLDFYLSNVEDGLATDGTKVHYKVDDVEGDITEWSPHYIENLQRGEHTVELQLVGADGQPVAGPFNDTTRSIQVGDCEEANESAEEEAGEEGDEAEEAGEADEAGEHGHHEAGDEAHGKAKKNK